jgi:hypothetical protein
MIWTAIIVGIASGIIGSVIGSLSLAYFLGRQNVIAQPTQQEEWNEVVRNNMGSAPGPMPNYRELIPAVEPEPQPEPEFRTETGRDGENLQVYTAPSFD